MRFIIVKRDDRLFISTEGRADHICEIFEWGGVSAEANAVMVMCGLQAVSDYARLTIVKKRAKEGNQ